MGLPDFAIKKPVTIFMILFGLAVFGAVSIFYLPLNFLPTIDQPIMTVYVPYQSSMPSEVERTITIPLEESLATLTGLKTIKSSSSENSSYIVLDFEGDADMDMATVEIRDRVDRVRGKLPSDVRRVIIRRFSTDQIPVAAYSIVSDVEKEELSRIVNDVLQVRLERLEGVAQVSVYGIETRQIDIELRLSSLRAYNINLYQVFRDLASNNINLSAGYVFDADSKFYIRTIGEFDDVSEIENVPIAGGRLKLKDIAKVIYDFPERQGYYRLNGKDAVAITVLKENKANLVEVTNRIRDCIEEFKQDKQYSKLETQVIWDASSQIHENLDLLQGNGLIGAIFVILILYVFLRKFRSLLIITVAIPLSVLIAFAIFYLLNSLFGMNFSINLLSLMGLILSVGMLVDNSVVVLESIFRYKEEGVSAKEAAVRGSKEVVTAVFAATLTTVSVFMALMFSGGSQVEVWMKDFGISITVVMFSSLLVALTLVPMASSVLFRQFKPGKGRFRDFFMGKFSSFINNLLRYRWITIFLTVVLLIFAFNLYRDIKVNYNFGATQRRVDIDVTLAHGLSKEERLNIIEKTEQVFLEHKEDLEMTSVISSIGRTRGTFTLYLEDETKSKKSTEEIKKEAVKILPVFPGVLYKSGLNVQGTGRLSLSVRIKGADRAILEDIGKELEAKFKEKFGSKSVYFNLEEGDERVVVSLNRIRSQRYGASPMLVGYSLLAAYGERPVTYYNSTEGEVPIIIGLGDEEKEGVSSVKKMGIQGGSKIVPLETIAGFSLRKGPATLEREDKEAVAQVQVVFSFSQFFEVVQNVSGYMKDYKLPTGYTWSFGEYFMRQFTERDSTSFAIILALIMVYIIMVALFESFVHPFTIMTSIPFAFIGSYLLMYFTGTGIDNMTRIGFLVLIGIVVNNAIVLIDYINQLRKEGNSRKDAIVIASSRRLRPIVITALTTILALLPMAAPALFPGLFETGNASTGQWAPLALVLVGGLTMSTFLTLIVVPCIYTVIDDISRSVKRTILKI